MSEKIKEYQKSFLEDERLFSGLRELTQKSFTSPESARELFRIVHTIKGNAITFGIEPLAGYAHLIEELLTEFLKTGYPTPLQSQKRKILEHGINQIQTLARSSLSSLSSSIKQFDAEQKEFFLVVKIGRTPVYIPSKNVTEVARQFEIIRLPKIARAGNSFFAAVRVRNRLYPVMAFSEAVMERRSPWAVILDSHLSLFADDVQGIEKIDPKEVPNYAKILNVTDFIKKRGA